MTADDSTVVVNIFGKTYSFALERDQTADQLREIAQMVDASMHRSHDAHPTQTPVQVAVLAGLNLVQELFRLQSEYQAAETDIQQRASRLTASLDRVFQENRFDILRADSD